ncbi:GntR family transcriptional regulator/MocR family aminotransferase [Agromyces hippuratus]|uniref:GntR family transcriptional regulator/MocR family aminotransferase n=1 Tax=Agromyces hippuratus TaxID=286438 RepID=A0A852WUW8_9MICO|nr:PLP-dependent aminotransferase family protein [Agromyces hippuratus]NYG21457.1 GntR family transcriptional regulator/MocR family aminotransferase [Agromyces hippuratus]
MSRSGPVLAWETLLDLGPGPAPLRDRLERAIREAVRSGRLPPGADLPPSRTLAETLGISRWVATETYGQLVAEGFLEAKVGSGTRVPAGRRHPLAPGAHDVRTVDREPAVVPLRAEYRRPRFDLGPGVPDLRHVPRARWAGAVRRALDRLPDAEFTVVDRLGHPLARTAVADYLSRSRRVNAAPDDVVITHGATDAMVGVAAGLRAAGHTALLVEDPSWSRLREIAATAGLTPVPVRVDASGVDVDAMIDAARRTGARAALITPAHQFPLGAALSPARREAIVRWAREVDGVLIEDDYDAEFRYDRRPIAALQGLAPEHVVLVGSLSKSMAQAFGLGWAVMPRALRERVPLADRARPSTLDQVALAEFITAGDLERHLRAARGRFRRRRATLLAALERELPGLAVTGIAAGMHAVLDLPPGIDAGAVRRAAADAEIAVSELTGYRASGATPNVEALVIGYGNLSDALIDEAVARLAGVIRSLA